MPCVQLQQLRLLGGLGVGVGWEGYKGTEESSVCT